METEEELKDATDGAQLRTMLWLGREEDFSPNQRPELSNRIAIFAECVSDTEVCRLSPQERANGQWLSSA